MYCAVCTTLMQPDLLEDTYRCTQCGLYSSTLPVRINDGERIDEQMRTRALRPIRMANFRHILEQCVPLLPSHARLLDVGCAHGWFLEAAEDKGYQPFGIEPDETMTALAKSIGYNVIAGSFPDALPAEKTYDIITFNDVFEHLQNLSGAIAGIHDHLEAAGLVMLNLPLSDGSFFRLARVAARFGWKSPLSRLWQRGLPSPHRSYFSTSTIVRFMQQNGFTLVKSGVLDSIVTRGLFERIRYDRKMGIFQASVIYLATRAIQPLIGLFPSDTGYFIFRHAPVVP